ncbi:MAG: hypothetical protein ICV71_02845 [Thermoleophilia bacterium]|nr:hypothetical protein [Thermoleophilia bacterium]
MQVALRIFLFAGGPAVALVASSRAVEYTRALAAALGAPAFVVGVGLVSMGTDLPEVANSIAARGRHQRRRLRRLRSDAVHARLRALPAGVVVVGASVLAVAIVVRAAPGLVRDESAAVRYRNPAAQAVIILVTLALVGFGATVAVRALVARAEAAAVRELAIAFSGASIGTSAREIAVDITALCRGVRGIAMGDALGARSWRPRSRSAAAPLSRRRK